MSKSLESGQIEAKKAYEVYKPKEMAMFLYLLGHFNTIQQKVTIFDNSNLLYS